MCEATDATVCVGLLHAIAAAAGVLVEDARTVISERVSSQGQLDRAMVERDEQQAVHGLAWWATYSQVLANVAQWAAELHRNGDLGATEVRLAQLLAAEYVAQLAGGVPMGQSELVRPSHLGLTAAHVRARFGEPLLDRLDDLALDAAADIAKFLVPGTGVATLENAGLGAELDQVRSEFRRFADQKIAPYAQGWHRNNDLIPLDLMQDLAELGVLGLTIPEEYGGAGMGKVAMCVVSEELSRGYLGVGSLPTRTEIAAELILASGTQAQREAWLPKLARGDIIPTAAFTEPGSGSDLASLRTRANRNRDDFDVTGSKTWITHAARADLMTLLVRTDPASHDHRGLSMLLAPKSRATEHEDFPDAGLSGSEIPVIGYRGMREYELAFDGFRVPAENLLGGVVGLGFKQLMNTFESARIQTAARALGVAQCALEIGLGYASERQQFGRPLSAFPRVRNKLAMIAAEIVGVRQLTYFAARRKDEGLRCDLEAGMAKLLAARVAWAAADSVLQIHGGNGYSMEYPVSRLLADARVLNIFEGAAEVQAQVIGRRLLEPTNARTPA